MSDENTNENQGSVIPGALGAIGGGVAAGTGLAFHQRGDVIKTILDADPAKLAKIKDVNVIQRVRDAADQAPNVAKGVAAPLSAELQAAEAQVLSAQGKFQAAEAAAAAFKGGNVNQLMLTGTAPNITATFQAADGATHVIEGIKEPLKGFKLNGQPTANPGKIGSLFRTNGQAHIILDAGNAQIRHFDVVHGDMVAARDALKPAIAGGEAATAKAAAKANLAAEVEGLGLTRAGARTHALGKIGVESVEAEMQGAAKKLAGTVEKEIAKDSKILKDVAKMRWGRISAAVVAGAAVGGFVLHALFGGKHTNDVEASRTEPAQEPSRG